MKNVAHVSGTHSAAILQHLFDHGQLLDSEIAAATGISLRNVRAALTGMASRGEIAMCSVTRFNDEKPVTGMLCRVAGSIPPTGPGRKPGAKD